MSLNSNIYWQKSFLFTQLSNFRHPLWNPIFFSLFLQKSFFFVLLQFLSPLKNPIRHNTSKQNNLKKKNILLVCRFRPTQTKTKKTKTETKLEFFGFEDKEDQEGEEGSEAGKSSYKIKYFGFDDLSESDSDDESSQAKEKKARKAAAALAALSSSVDSPHTSDSQDSHASSNTGKSSP